MSQLVFIENGNAVTDSLTIAEVFGKEHDKVMRDIVTQINKLIEAGELDFSTANFVGSTYISRGKNYEKFNLSEDAFTLIAMSYTTVEAMKFKVKFIQEFKRMRETIKTVSTPSYMIDDPISRAQKWIQELKEKQAVEQQLQLAAPMIEKYQQFLNSDGLMDMKNVAKIVGWGRNNLFSFLREEKVFMKDNTPYQTYMNREYFKLKAKPTPVGCKQVTLVTPKGADYIAGLVNKMNQCS
ncbi:Rha family transcriptional regulator [Metabacillus sp. cB07]|uniref:Rha family transcriptional regulator n=1 Tax=Metabacillus sp. cB07 TaxID=2806989 RepID=UPI00193994CA|nr:Rha family transcriptional regulator [Metabacillus sp. cB07]